MKTGTNVPYDDANDEDDDHGLSAQVPRILLAACWCLVVFPPLTPFVCTLSYVTIDKIHTDAITRYGGLRRHCGVGHYLPVSS